MELQEIKDYLRITHSEDDEQLKEFVLTAQRFLEAKTGVVYNPDNLLHKQCVKFLAAHFYENRAALSEKTTSELCYTITSLLDHIEVTKE